MFEWFSPQRCADLFVHDGEHISVRKAAFDLARDVRAVSGCRMLFKPYLPADTDSGVVIGSLEDAAFARWVGELTDTQALADEWEGFRVIVTERLLVVAGSDRRGAMHGVYHLSRFHLGIDPCYLFTGSQPQPMETLRLPEGVYAGAPQTYRFRGWFLNDEDLLSDWKDGGGARHIDYPFYDQVIHPDALEMVLETAARLNINLIIPASFVDIQNPPEENLVRMAVERGMYVTQHHVEPLGVSHFGFENYWRARGQEEQFSFVTNREKVIECWKSAVEKWAKYDGVIWQLGLRGRGDRPAWQNDKAIDDSDQAHGAIISEAIRTQYELVKAVLGHDRFYSTATLWMEGTQLFHQGYLQFPKNTIIVFADAGLTQMFGKDFFELSRMPEYRYGLYYHVAFWGAGPHLVQGTDLRKMQYQYHLAMEKGDTAYSILNVSNVRELILCVQANAELVWDGAQFEESAFLNDFFRRHFGLENGAEYLHRHFEAFADYPQSDPSDGDAYESLWKAQFVLRQADFKQKVILDGVARGYAMECLHDMRGESPHKKNDALWVDALEKGIVRFEESYAALAQAYRSVQESGQAFFRDLLLVQEEIMLGLYHWAAACGRARMAMAANDVPEAARQLRHGVFALEKLLEDRRKAEHGAFEDWYRGDRKMNLPSGLALTRTRLEELNGRK